MANDLPTSGLLLHPAGASPSSRGFFIGNEQQGNLRNCTKLRKRLLGNERYGSLKELHKIEEEVGVPGAIPGGFLPSFLGSIFTPFLGRWRSRICLYMDVSGDWSAGRDPFSDVFWTVLFDTLLHVFGGTLLQVFCQLVRCLLHAVSARSSPRFLSWPSTSRWRAHQVNDSLRGPKAACNPGDATPLARPISDRSRYPRPMKCPEVWPRWRCECSWRCECECSWAPG
jgi:hypothetical protein